MNDEDIKILEELKEEYSKGLERLCDKDLSVCMQRIYTVRKKQVQAIGNLLKENKELKSKLIIAKGGNDYWCQKYCEVSKNSVPVAKIKEKIERLKKEKQKYKEENTMDEDYFFDINGFDNAIWVLQNLLEGK